MSNPLEFFDAIYCITLNPQSDRATIARRQFEDLGLCAEFITGERTIPYQKGCNAAHRQCVSLAKRKNCKNVLIFEDDVAFVNYNEKIIKDSLLNLPQDWEMFYLGGTITPPASVHKVTPNLLKLRVHEGHAYGVNSLIFDEILSWHDKNEDHITNLYEVFKECYCIHPLMTLQVDRLKPINSMRALDTNLRAQYLNQII